MRLRIRNWNKYQHYRDRNPPWIKLHKAILQSRDWVCATDSERVLAIACMLLASATDENDGIFEADPDYFQRVAYLHAKPDFKPLIQRGFLEVLANDSDVLAVARPETETETESISSKKNINININKSNQEQVALPEWLPIQEWESWIEVRKKMRNAPFTARARQLAISELTKLRDAGEDPIAVLNQAVARGYRGLFPVNGGNGNGNGHAGQQKLEQTSKSIARAIHNRAAIIEGLGISEHAHAVCSDLRPGTDAGRGTIVAANLLVGKPGKA